MKQNKNNFNILYDHTDFVIIEKSAGLLSVPERFTDKTSAKKLLRDQYGEIYTVHRLDRDTSGLMIFAKNEESHKIFNAMFRERQIKKKYHGLVMGRMPESTGIMDYPIMTVPGKNKVIIDKRGKESLSEYRVLEEFESYSLVEVEIFTGRTHQIRIHLRQIGNPLIVDETYGLKSSFLVSDIKGQRRYNIGKDETERPILSRTPLHATHLSFSYPGPEAVDINIDSTYPKDMRATINQLRKWGKKNVIS
ncbi:RluA family pseudouridine synthase [Membranihabitans marinus]|uniref:RluA family pseudouridine synthase n=1 Tax=Membranihabitans marinus TaxID=1227546 RepID=UPI001F33D9BF|nr:RNA pseudouridine synthase [Membranihabitans marinus]